jgi:1,4-alpha-glucan branching enzyme
MTLLSPQPDALVAGTTRLVFDQSIHGLCMKINGMHYHAWEHADTYTVDLNPFEPDIPIAIELHYQTAGGESQSDQIQVSKPRHDRGGMGATVIRDEQGGIQGVFFKFWLPQVKSVFVRGSFNDWQDVNQLDQLGHSGYWYGFSSEARPGDDYKFFVYALDGNLSEVSDPAARDTKKTHYNKPDHQDANGVIVDPAAFDWQHDHVDVAQRRDFRKHIIYQLHWGTFLRQGQGGELPFESFAAGDSEIEKRASIRQKLQYICDLGFTAIEFLPIHEANGEFNAGYDPSFFFAVESAYGKPEDLRMLVDEAHGLGLAVLFDSVINHLTKDETHSSFSQEFISGWYTRKDAPWSNHMQWGGDDWGPDPDFDRQEICKLLTDCMIMYLDEYHVDGIRFDATTTIPRHALKEIIGALKQHTQGTGHYLIAEHLTDDPFAYIVGDIDFDAGWYKAACDEGFTDVLGKPGQGELSDLCKVFESNYQGQAPTAVKYVLGSHDEIWSAHGGCATVSRWGGSANAYAQMKMRLAWALNICSLGTPMLFMGTETMTDISWHNYHGYNGNNEHTSGPGLDWSPEAHSIPGQFQQMIKDINGLRRGHDALQSDNVNCQLVHYDQTNGIAAYKRWDHQGSVFLIIVNISDNEWQSREYQVRTNTPHSLWREAFNSQYVAYGGWTGSGNSDPSFSPSADSTGLLQGINIPKWGLMILKQEMG